MVKEAEVLLQTPKPAELGLLLSRWKEASHPLGVERRFRMAGSLPERSKGLANSLPSFLPFFPSSFLPFSFLLVSLSHTHTHTETHTALLKMRKRFCWARIHPRPLPDMIHFQDEELTLHLDSDTKRKKRREATRETNSTQRTLARKSSQGADEITATHTAMEPKDLTEQPLFGPVALNGDTKGRGGGGEARKVMGNRPAIRGKRRKEMMSVISRRKKENRH